MRTTKLLAAAAGLPPVVAALVVALPAGATGQATTIVYTLSTATNEINASTPNQGWWSPESNLGFDTSPNYVVGTDGPVGTEHFRNFFTFDISSSGNPCVPSSAILSVEAAHGNQENGEGGPSSLSYSLFDVATAAATLNHKSLNPNTTIYNDLGTGTSYGGPYTLSTAVGPSTTFTLALNGNGLFALAQARASHLQYFSIGGSIVPTPASSKNYLFGNSDASATLTVTYPKLCRVA